MTNNRYLKAQRGNALFLILIAVALFAALSYAVTRSGRGSGGIDREQALIGASQITQYPAALRTTITRMIVTGTVASNLTFRTDPTNSADTEVFGSAGGAATRQDPPNNVFAGAVTPWRYKTTPGGNTGWFISGVGTNVGTGKDIFAFLDGLSEPVCTQINRGLGLAANAPFAVEATAVVLTSTDEGLLTQTGGGAASDTAGNNAYSFNIWNTTSAPGGAIAPQAFACVRNGAAGTFVYYHSLFEQ